MSQLKQNSNISVERKDLSYFNDLEFVEYSINENEIWKHLFSQQLENLKNKAIPVFFDYLKKYNLPVEKIPQLYEVSKAIKKDTGWEIVKVEELIDNLTFFSFLAERKFPSTTYIRQQEEIEISKDPDIFHELFGHVTMLFCSKHAHYLQVFGEIALTLSELELKLFQRLFWFTYEVGLINTTDGVKIYGGSVLSSLKESSFALFGDPNYRKPFSLVDILRSPYRADQLQTNYFILDDFQTLYNILDDKKYLIEKIWEAYELGEYKAHFSTDNSRYESINCCSKILIS